MIPLPTNIIPYWFFPWNTDSWPGFSAYIYHKEIFVIDAVRQMFPWKVFSFELLKQGIWPLWNPYNFAGQPLLANFQTSIFYPPSWFFLFLPQIIAWSAYILIQPVLLGIFSFLFFKKIFHKITPALISSTGLVFCAFFSIHYFWGVSTHPLIWLPLALYLIELFNEKKFSNLKFIFLLSIVFCLMILGGYPQSSVFSLGMTLVYFLFRCGKRGLLSLALALLLATGICSAQLLPTYELYKLSPREGSDSLEIVNNSFVSLKHLVMVISPDYFGSPATNNYSGGTDYSGVNSYFGIALLPLALYAMRNLGKNKKILFWSAVSVSGLLMSLPNFISHLPSVLKIPIIGSGAPWYYLLFFQIGMIVLAGYGWLELSVKEKREKSFIILLISVSIVIGLLTIIGLNSSVSLNNTLKIVIVFAAFAASYLLFPKKAGISAAVLTLVFGLYFWQRVMPFGEMKYFYPPHPLISFLQQYSKVDRFWGPSNAQIPSDLGALYHISQLEGYDSLWPKRYGELVAGAQDGKFHPTINRAEVFVSQDDTFNRRRLLNLLGVKYFIDKSDNPNGDSGHNFLKYPSDSYKLVKQWKVVSVYENLNSFPRAFLVSDYIVVNGQKTIEKVYDPTVNLRNTAVLNIDPKIKNITGGSAEIEHYDTLQVNVRTKSDGPSILILSDNFFPGWNVYVNSKKSKLMNADYSLRAVVVPQGVNEVSFKYEPESFNIGLKISAISLMLLCLIFLLSLRKNGSR